MFVKLKTRLGKELAHYYHLGGDVRRLLISYYLYLAAYPLFGVFVSAYLWQAGETLGSLVIYNLLYCVGLPLGFYLNGYLLRHFHTLRLYALGAVIQGLSGILVVFFSTTSLTGLAAYGLIYGVGAGLYWGNKNYLSQRLTRGSNRLYYNSLESSGDMLINIFMPVLAGTLITFGSHFNLYLTETGYRLGMGLGLILTIISGLIVQSSQIQDLAHEKVLVKTKSTRWNQVRLYNFLFNIAVGAEFVIPGVLILALVGNEGTLGIVSSATAALSAITLYLLGRKGEVKNIWRFVALGSFIYLSSTLLLSFGLNLVSILVYQAASTIGWAFRWSPGYTLTMEIMDQEDGTHQYAYVCDNELFFNLGRVVGLLIILAVASRSQVAAMQFVPLIVGVTGLFALIPLKKMSQISM